MPEATLNDFDELRSLIDTLRAGFIDPSKPIHEQPASLLEQQNLILKLVQEDEEHDEQGYKQVEQLQDALFNLSLSLNFFSEILGKTGARKNVAQWETYINVFHRVLKHITHEEEPSTENLCLWLRSDKHFVPTGEYANWSDEEEKAEHGYCVNYRVNNKKRK